jgi:hypothetical protein
MLVCKFACPTGPNPVDGALARGGGQHDSITKAPPGSSMQLELVELGRARTAAVRYHLVSLFRSELISRALQQARWEISSHGSAARVSANNL